MHKEAPESDYCQMMRFSGYRYVEASRRIKDQNYFGSAWCKPKDPNVEVYLDLIEQEGWDAPVLYFSASEPNATIYVVQTCIMNADGGPIRWLESDPNDYAKFLKKKITFRYGTHEFIINPKDPNKPIETDAMASDDWLKSSNVKCWGGNMDIKK